MKRNNLKSITSFIIIVLFAFNFISCRKDKNDNSVPIADPTAGTYNRDYVSSLNGFFEQRPALLETNGVMLGDFIRMSIDSSWGLSAEQRDKLKAIRDQVVSPTHKTLLQKAVTLYDMENYVTNKYGGTVGGFVCVAGDVKSLQTLRDVYWGLRFDYPGTYWDTTDAGYAVIRYTTNCVQNIYIPYSPEMGGSYEHSWPNTGGGFTASALGNGGFPEYAFTGYHSPNEGGEIYSVTADGKETLVAKFTDNQWVKINEDTKSDLKNPVRNGIYARFEGKLYATASLENGGYRVIDENIDMCDVESLVKIETYSNYKGEKFYVRGCDGLNYFLTTTDAAVGQKMTLKYVEKGVYGFKVSMDDVEKVWEEVINVVL